MRGFTVIELLLVIATTILIGALGFTAYRTYAVRAVISDSVQRAAALQTLVAEAFQHSGLPPLNRLDVELPVDQPDTENPVASIDIDNGRINIRFGADADPAIALRTLSLTPFETADQEIVWICGNRVPGVGLKPLGFASGARQAVQVLTPIEARYLPATCR